MLFFGPSFAFIVSASPTYYTVNFIMAGELILQVSVTKNVEGIPYWHYPYQCVQFEKIIDVGSFEACNRNQDPIHQL